MTAWESFFLAGVWTPPPPTPVDPLNIVARGSFFPRTQLAANTIRSQARLRVTLDAKVQTLATLAPKVDVIGGLQ